MATQLLQGAAAQLASRLDRAFVEALITPSERARRLDPAESLSVAERLPRLDLLRLFYNQPDFLGSTLAVSLSEPERGARVRGEGPGAIAKPPKSSRGPGEPFFTRLPMLRPQWTRVRRLGKTGEVVDLSWPSAFEPLWSTGRVAERLAQLRESKALSDPQFDSMSRLLNDVEAPQGRSADFSRRYLERAENQVAHARWFRHRQGPRPAIMLIHGHMGGFLPVEERLWPTMKLFHGGMDVLFMTLPLHGKRRDRSRGLRPPNFPGTDPRATIEGFRHLVHDYLSLSDHLLRTGQVSSIGLGGMSLGGYSVALLATLDPRFTFALMLVPLACIADFAHDNGRLLGDPLARAQQARALSAAQAVISPLARPSLIPNNRVLVVHGRADRVTGSTHAQRLTTHFGARTATFPGGHLLQFGREAAFEPLYDLLQEEFGLPFASAPIQAC